MASPPFDKIVSFTDTWHNDTYPAISPTRPELSAAGKNVVITGGGSGIGEAAAIAFAQAGAKSVSIIGRRVDRLESSAKKITEANPSTLVVTQPGDTTDRASIEGALRAIVVKIDSKIDIFLDNAGMLSPDAPVVGYPEKELRRALEVNLLGPFNSLQAFTPLAAAGAKVIHTGTGISHWSLFEEVTGVWSYAASKAASQKMIDHYAFENPDIHVVSFQPGIVGTEINYKIPVGPDTVELPGHYVVWLASDEARFLRNKFVWANWDVDELRAKEEQIRSSFLLRVTLNGVDM